MNNQSYFVITTLLCLRGLIYNKRVLRVSNNSDVLEVGKYKGKYKIYLNGKLVFSTKNIIYLEKRIVNYINIYNLNTIN